MSVQKLMQLLVTIVGAVGLLGSLYVNFSMSDIIDKGQKGIIQDNPNSTFNLLMYTTISWGVVAFACMILAVAVMGTYGVATEQKHFMSLFTVFSLLIIGVTIAGTVYIKLNSTEERIRMDIEAATFAINRFYNGTMIDIKEKYNCCGPTRALCSSQDVSKDDCPKAIMVHANLVEEITMSVAIAESVLQFLGMLFVGILMQKLKLAEDEKYAAM